MKPLRTNIIIVLLSVSSACFAQIPNLKPISEKKQLEIVTPMEKKGKWGYANEKGKFIIKNVFDAAEAFEGPCARVCVGGKWGLLSSNGTFILMPTYDEIKTYSGKGYTLVRLAGKWGTINTLGEILTPVDYDAITARNGFSAAIVEKNGLYGSLKSDGSINIEPVYTEIGDFNGKYAIAKIGTRTGIVDSYLRSIITADYDDIQPFGYGLLKVCNDNREGLCDENGKTVVYMDYDELTMSGKGFMVSHNNNGYGIMKIVGMNNIEEIIKPCLAAKPDISKFPAVFVYNGKISIINASSNIDYPLPSGVIKDVDSNLDVPSASGEYRVHKIATDVNLSTINNKPAYILTNEGKCIWAANSKMESYANTPISTSFAIEKHKKEMIKKGYEDGEQVYITQTWDVDWPMNAVDKRLDIRPVQKSLASDIIDYLEGKRNYVDTSNMVYEDIEKYFFDSEGGQIIKSIPSNVDYEQTREYVLGVESEQSEVKGCALFEISQYIYLGGAHGVESNIFRYYNLSNGKRITLNDLFDYDQRKKMLSIIRSRPIDSEGNRVDSDDVQYEDIDELPDNFVIKNNVIYFQFDVYELASYAYGAPLLGIRLSEIR